MAGLDEQCECPLCMEPLEIDDISFYPCTCGYQICRFCWHRIRTDENGLCPACRKQYSEDPAEFKPLTDDELQRIKKERRQKDIQRKQKAAESRKHLANVRVVQRNLVFVVGLSQRLADPDQLRKQEYFGKFGKIHKVVINQSTSYAGSQVRSKGPSASAYVTYCRPSDALKAILNVNNVHIDGRTLKASLGTTKYCSHFLKGTQCQKVDCMYLHELGEEAASFTKEEMQMGKHQEYEQKLLQQYQNSQNVNNHKQVKKATSPVTIITPTVETPPQMPPPLVPLVPPCVTNDATNGWPPLNKPDSKPTTPPIVAPIPPPPPPQPTQAVNVPRTRSISDQHTKSSPPKQNHTPPPPPAPVQPEAPAPASPPKPPSPREPPQPTVKPPIPTTTQAPVVQRRSLVFDNSNSHSLSLFSGDCFTPRIQHTTHQPQHPPVLSATRQYSTHQYQTPSMYLQRQTGRLPLPPSRPPPSPFPPSPLNPPPYLPPTVPTDTVLNPPIPDTLNVSTTTDWQAAFGFSNASDSQDEDLGFDPLEESAKGLADLMQKEQMNNHQHAPAPHVTWPQPYPLMAPPPHLPPGFTHPYPKPMLPNNPILPHEFTMNGSRMMGLMNLPPGHLAQKLHQHPGYTNRQTDGPDIDNSQSELFSTKDWQDGLRALLPNINISFGSPNQPPTQQNPQLPPHCQTYTSHPPHNNSMDVGGPWVKQMHPYPTSDPNTDTQTLHNHRLPFVQQFSLRGAAWPPQTRNPPPGFQSMPPSHTQDQHTVADPLQ